jgi:phosphonate transport system substrate-binding protein
MKILIRIFFYYFLSLPFLSLSQASDKNELTFGLFPYITPTQLVQIHSPLKNYLSKTLGLEVNLVTAPDFTSFMERTQQGEYDIILTAPHLGRLAEKRDGYKRVAMTGHRVEGIFLAKKESEINSLGDLKNKKIMAAQRISVIYQMALKTLADKGLIDGQNITIIETKTHNNALYAPLRDEADASVTGILLWHTLGQEYKDKLKVIGHTNSVPGFVLLSHPRIPEKIQKDLHKALFDFGKTAEGKLYFESNGFKEFLPIDEKTMIELDPYTKIFTEK